MYPDNTAQLVASWMSQALAKMPTPRPMTPAQRQKIRTACERWDKTLSELYEKRENIEPERRHEVQKLIAQAHINRNLIYFQLFRINDLPTEILTIILRDVVWSSTMPETGILHRFRISWVCKRWREVAIADTTLWSAIWFRDPPPHERSFCWFDRAGASTLDIRVGEPRDSNLTYSQMEAFLDRLFTKLEQIRSLVVVVDNWPPALVLLDKIKSYSKKRTFASLERFELHRNGSPYVWIGAGYEPDRHRNPMALFGGALLPKLREITINGVHIDWTRSALAQLTRFDLRRIPLEMSPTLARFRDILRACPNLCKLSLDGAGPVWTPVSAAEYPPIHLDRLKHLVIGDYSLQYAVYVMSQIIAPNVRELTLMNLIGEDYTPFFALVTGRFPEVRLLTTYNIEVVATSQCRAVMIKWLKSMPKLAFLRIANLRMNFLQLFLSDGEDPACEHPLRFENNQLIPPRQIIAPKLVYLEVFANEPSLVVSFVLARKAMGVPFRKVFVDQKLSVRFTSDQTKSILGGSQIYILPAPVQTAEEVEVLAS